MLPRSRHCRTSLMMRFQILNNYYKIKKVRSRAFFVYILLVRSGSCGV